MILGQAKRAVARLNEEEQADVRLVAVTIDPENDTQESMARLAAGQEVAAPFFNLCVGAPGTINPILDRLGIERYLDPKTGIIEHTNLFLVIDRGGKIAYRLSLGSLQEEWLVEALRVLCAEPEPKS